MVTLLIACFGTLITLLTFGHVLPHGTTSLEFVFTEILRLSASLIGVPLCASYRFLAGFIELLLGTCSNLLDGRRRGEGRWEWGIGFAEAGATAAAEGGGGCARYGKEKGLGDEKRGGVVGRDDGVPGRGHVSPGDGNDDEQRGE